MTEGGASEWIAIIRVCESDTQSLDLSLPRELPFKKKKKWLKHFFFPAVCKSALNVASIRRASPSLQQAAGAAAYICCGNEDGTEAKGKGYRQVGEEGKKNRWSAQERRSELEVEYWKEVIISKLICRTVSQAQHPQKKWVFKAAVIGPFKHTEL